MRVSTEFSWLYTEATGWLLRIFELHKIQEMFLLVKHLLATLDSLELVS